MLRVIFTPFYFTRYFDKTIESIDHLAILQPTLNLKKYRYRAANIFRIPYKKPALDTWMYQISQVLPAFEFVGGI